MPLGSLTPTEWFIIITSVSSSGNIREEAILLTNASIGLSIPAGMVSLSNKPNLTGIQIIGILTVIEPQIMFLGLIRILE